MEATDTRAAPVTRPPAVRPKVVYVHAPIALGTIIGPEGSEYRVRVGADEQLYERDPSVDPALLEQASKDGVRVVVEPSTRMICGVLMVAPALTIDRRGDVRAKVRAIELEASEGFLLKTAASFFQLDDTRAEIFARETVIRARDAFRALGRFIKLN